eukprot:jgi/Chrzof1/15209/Cz09g31210.t1
MGASASRSAARSYKAAEAGATAAVKQADTALQTVPQGVLADAAKAAAMKEHRGPVIYEEQDRDQSFDNLLSKIGGAIHDTRLDSAHQKAQPAAAAAAAADMQQGRLPPPAMRELFELQSRAAGQTPDVSALLQKYEQALPVPVLGYKVSDHTIVERVFQYTCKPVLVETHIHGPERSTAYAHWPDWFQRRNL